MASPPTPTPTSEHDFLLTSYLTLHSHLLTLPTSPSPIPTHPSILSALSSLPTRTSPTYLSPHRAPQTLSHIYTSLLPALAPQSLSSRYYAFVTGGVLPIAAAADNIVTAYDQNVQVHFPSNKHSAAPAVEDAALRMLGDLLELGDGWEAKTFTTGATGANILGLAVGREAVVARRGGGGEGVSVAEQGVLGACLAAGVRRVQVLSSMGHSSLGKAAGVVGLGRGAVVEVGREGEPWRLDLERVGRELEKGAEEGVVSIVVVGAGEVNTGGFATRGLDDMREVRRLADRWGAWVHVDGGEFPVL